MLVTASSPLPTMFSTVSKTNFNILVTFVLSCAKFNAFNLDKPKILLFGKELKLYTKAKHVSLVQTEIFAKEKSKLTQMTK